MQKNSYKIPETKDLETKDSERYLSPEVVNHVVDERKCYVFSFEKYQRKKCEIDNLEKSSHKKILKWFQNVGEAETIEDIKRIGIGDSVLNVNEYRSLFTGLEPDVDMLEYKLDRRGRLFYYVDDGKKIVYCILIKNKHFEKK